MFLLQRIILTPSYTSNRGISFKNISSITFCSFENILRQNHKLDDLLTPSASHTFHLYTAFPFCKSIVVFFFVIKKQSVLNSYLVLYRSFFFLEHVLYRSNCYKTLDYYKTNTKGMFINKKQIRLISNHSLAF